VQQVLSDEQAGQEANRALQRCLDVLQEEIRSARGRDYSLCHGVIGCADVLLSADQMRGMTQFTARIHELAAIGIKRFAATHAWPSGVSRGENPGLLPGLAGTGHFYLRLSDPASVATVLLPGALV
jgi:lantibiotic modifying enzyme